MRCPKCNGKIHKLNNEKAQCETCGSKFKIISNPTEKDEKEAQKIRKIQKTKAYSKPQIGHSTHEDEEQEEQEEQEAPRTRSGFLNNEDFLEWFDELDLPSWKPIVAVLALIVLVIAIVMIIMSSGILNKTETSEIETTNTNETVVAESSQNTEPTETPISENANESPVISEETEQTQSSTYTEDYADEDAIGTPISVTNKRTEQAQNNVVSHEAVTIGVNDKDEENKETQNSHSSSENEIKENDAEQTTKTSDSSEEPAMLVEENPDNSGAVINTSASNNTVPTNNTTVSTDFVVPITSMANKDSALLLDMYVEELKSLFPGFMKTFVDDGWQIVLVPTLNESQFGGPDKELAGYTLPATKTIYIVSDGYEYLIRHEIGHYLDHIYGRTQGLTWITDGPMFQMIYAKEGQNLGAAGALNAGEFYAEVFRNMMENPAGTMASCPEAYAYVTACLETINNQKGVVTQ